MSMVEEKCQSCQGCNSHNTHAKIIGVKKPNTKWRSLLIIILLLAAALSLNSWLKNRDFISQIDSLIPQAQSYKKLSTNPQVYAAIGKNGTAIGYCGVGEGRGYGGNIRIAVAIDDQGEILGTKVLEQKETPAYFAKLIKNDYFAQYQHKDIKKDAFELNIDVNAVSGATVSSRGSINAIIDGIKGIAVQKPELVGASNWDDRGQKNEFNSQDIYPLIALIILISMAVYGSAHNRKKLRWGTMIAGILILGIWQKRMLSLAVIGNFLMNPLLYMRISLFSTVLLITTVLICLLLRKNLYCYWLCPFGAAQEIIFRASGSKNPKINKKVRDILGRITRILAAAALIAGIALGNPGLTSYEPFSTLFGFNGGSLEWLLLAVVMIGAFFIERFWCRLFCPIGIINNWLLKYGYKTNQAIKKNAEH